MPLSFPPFKVTKLLFPSSARLTKTLSSCISHHRINPTPISSMGASPHTSSSDQSHPFLPSPPPPPEPPIYGLPVPLHPPFEDHPPPAYFLLPIYPLHLRRRRRCCFLQALSASSSLIAFLFSILLLASAIFLLWPSDPELTVVRLRLDRFRVRPLPSASIDIAMGLQIKIRNPDLFGIDYTSIVASIFYHQKLLGSVSSEGGHVAGRGVSFVDADLHLDGVRVLEDVIYLIGDVAKGSVEFDTVTEVRGWLRLFFFDVPVKGKISCLTRINPDDQTISYQDCYPA